MALIVGGLLFSALAALYLARSMVRPIGVLQEGAQRIGAGDLEQKIEVRTGDELEALAGQFNRMTEQLRDSYAGLERKVEERTVELKQALEFQGASGEILSSISNSIADTQPVFDAIVENVVRLFGTPRATVLMLRGDQLHLMAAKGSEGRDSQFGTVFPQPLDPTTLTGRALTTGKLLQIAPIIGNPEASERAVNLARQFGYDALIVAPMVRDGKVIGAIGTVRAEPVPFDDKQVALLRTFADQAVIAIENVRMFNETKEALERQTATSDILKVISSSTTDTQPVFDAIVQSGLKLFPDATVAVTLPDGDQVKLAAVANRDKNFNEAWWKRFPFPLSREYMHGIALLDRRMVDVPDAATNNDPALGTGMANFLASGNRAITIMPMMRGDAAIGTVTVARDQPGPLSDKQLALLRTFADQAVIAIENVRLFNETREGLEQQTAISEVLRVISNSPGDVRPVLQAVAERSARICDAKFADIIVVQGQGLGVAAATGDLGRPQSGETVPLTRTTAMGRSILDRKVVHVPDIDAAGAEFPLGRELALRFGHRTTLAVPLVREDKALGTILLRRTEVRPFEDKHIALLRTFADQAAIAIENARLYEEAGRRQREAELLADVIRSINGSLDLSTVLRRIAEGAREVCHADMAFIALRDPDSDTVAFRQWPGARYDDYRSFRVAAGQGACGLVLSTGRPFRTDNYLEDTRFGPEFLPVARIEELHAYMAVPITIEDRVEGFFSVANR
ncbi:MAG TPA: GAF domain-containing protein, partial [Steroidobacteraceae bacterium]